MPKILKIALVEIVVMALLVIVAGAVASRLGGHTPVEEPQAITVAPERSGDCAIEEAGIWVLQDCGREHSGVVFATMARTLAPLDRAVLEDETASTVIDGDRVCAELADLYRATWPVSVRLVPLSQPTQVACLAAIDGATEGTPTPVPGTASSGG